MQATPLFFLPGLLEDADLIASQAAALRGSRPCAVADLTGQPNPQGVIRRVPVA